MSSGSFISRRKFLKRSFAFSASAALATQVGCGGTVLAPSVQEQFSITDPASLLMLGDWGWEGDATMQASVASAM